MQPSAPRSIMAPRSVIVPPWIPVVLGELGVLEDTRVGKSNPRIEGYHAITFAGAAPDDEAWCASAVGWALEAAGHRSTRSKTAATYATYGVPCGRIFGALAVFPKSDPDAGGSGHVAFLLGTIDLGKKGMQAWIVGGNQTNAVTIATRPAAGMVTRWPSTFPLPPALRA